MSISGTDVLFTPTPSYNGPASFEYTLQDDGTTNEVDDPKTATATASFTITEINDAPVGVNDSLSNIAEDSGTRTISFASLLANDSAGPLNESEQTLTITSVHSAVGGTVTISGTDVLFTPTADYNGPASFEYTLQDEGTTNGVNDPKTTTATASFAITAVDDLPTVVVPDDQITPQNVDLAIGGITVGDVDTASLTTILQVSHGTVTLPTTTGLSVLGNGTANVFLAGTINDLNAALASLSYRGTVDFHGSDSLIVTVSDSHGLASDSVGITVNEFNEPPVSVDDSLSSIAEDSGTRTISFASLLANDSAGPANESEQTLTISSVDSAVGGTVSTLGTDVVFTPTPDYHGPASFEYTLQDNGTTNGVDDPKTATATASFTITEVNDAPVGVNDSLSSVAEDSGTRTISFASLLANDSAGPANESEQTLTITSVDSAVGGTVSILGTDVLFTPTLDYNGPASFEYTLQDEGTTNGVDDPKTTTATVSFAITEVNDAPTLVVPGDQTTFQNVDLTIDGITVGDVDTASLTTILQVSHGTVTLLTTTGLTVTGNGTGLVEISGDIADLNAALASLVYLGDVDYSGSDSLQITIDDGTESINANVAIIVKALSEQADDLQAQVDTLLTTDVLTSKEVRSLEKRLELTGKAKKDIKNLETFIDEVNDLFDDGVLTQEQANSLLTAANFLLTGIQRG